MKIKVVQLNIWRGELLENAVEFLKKENADIILLQEVYNGKEKKLPAAYRCFDYLNEVFPYYKSAFKAQFCDITDFGNIDEGNAIYSKFPIKNYSMHFFDIPYSTFNNHEKKSFEDNPQGILNALIDINGKEVNVYCVHGVWGFDGLDNDRRLTMSRKIVSLIKDKKNIIMGGDFNLNPDTKTIEKIEEHLKSVFKLDLVSTFNMNYKKNSGYAAAAVDMMFVSKNIGILKKECPRVDVSDHLPLVVEVEL